MTAVKIRELMHHFSGYLKLVKNGEMITIYDRNTPVADLIQHRDVRFPGWKRKINKISVKGPSLSKSAVKMKRESR